MAGRILIGVLVITIIGAAGVGIYDALKPVVETTESLPVEVAVQEDDTLVSVDAGDKPEGIEAAIQQDAEQVSAETNVSQQQDEVQPQTVVGRSQGNSQQGAMDMVGAPWQATGTIAALDANGVDLMLEDGNTVFLELGPETYWKNQGVTLTIGQQIQVEGFFNGDQYHAATVTTAAQEQIALRSEAGQPLWSGGANSNGNSNGNGNAAAAGEIQVAAEDWLTINGTLTVVSNNTVTFQPANGTAAQILQLGRPDFWQNQGVALAVGDDVDVLGFWQGEQFKVGEIKSTFTGDRIMLLDPNGRPLWGGPGRNGNGGEGGQGQNDQGQGNTGNGGQGQGNQGQGNTGNGGPGQGNQGNGGQGQGQNQAANLVPAEQWTELSGNIVVVEPLRIMVQTAAGETALVNLGQVDFWTEQGYAFTIPEAVTVEGYWLNGQFEAGRITDASATLVIRDDTGQLVYGTQGQGGQGNGNQSGGKQYRGGRS